MATTPSPTDLFTYQAEVRRVVDGDTVELALDLGFSIMYRHSCRLFGINAPEHGTEAGDAAKAYLTNLLPVGTQVIVKTQKDNSEKYGRILGTIVIPEKKAVKKTKTAAVPAVNVNEQLVSTGHAKPWDGTGARPV